MFRVGDIIKGTNSRYGYTDFNMTKGLVVEVREGDDNLVIRVLAHQTHPELIGKELSCWQAKPEDFEVVGKETTSLQMDKVKAIYKSYLEQNDYTSAQAIVEVLEALEIEIES